MTTQNEFKTTFNGFIQKLENNFQYLKTKVLTIPKSVSELTNDSNFITLSDVQAQNYATKEELNDFSNGMFKIVEELPTTNISKKTFYFVPMASADQENDNLYDEYVYINNKWEHLGVRKINLTDYALKSEIPTKTSDLTNDSFYTQDDMNTLLQEVFNNANITVLTDNNGSSD